MRDTPLLVRVGVLAMATACVLAAVTAGYFISTNRASKPVAPPGATRPPHGEANREAGAAVEKLAARLRDNPEDGEGWVMMGRSLAALGRFPEAADAFREAQARLPRNPSVLADRADALAMANGRRFDGEPDRLIAAALSLDAGHTKALALAGTSAYGRGDYPAAAEFWRRLLAGVPADSPMAREVEGRRRDAEARAAARGRPRPDGR